MAQTPGASTAHSPLPYNQLSAYGMPTPHSPVLPYPPKEQRLSPNNISPYASPQLTKGTIPKQNPFASSGDASQFSAHSMPYLNGSHFAASPPAQSSPYFSSMAPPSTPGVMGPPSKPVEDKPVDVNDLGDVLAGSGVDIREEEANLVGMTRKPGQQNMTQSSISTVSATPDISSSYFDHPSRGYSIYSQNLVGPRSSFYGAGTFTQPTLTEEQLRQQVEHEQRALVRRRATIASQHINVPFLEAGKLVYQMKRVVDTRGLKLPDNQAVPDARTGNPRVSVLGTPHTESLVVVNGGTQLTGMSSDILSLTSLACKDHVRNLLEHAVWLSRARKETANGTVPPELKDLATGDGQAEEVELSMSSAQSKKRSFADTDKSSTLDAASQPKRVKTIAFPKRTTQLLASLSERERAVEEERIKKRAARNMSQLSGDGTPLGPGTPGSGIPAAQIGAALAEAKKMSKKEQKKASQFQESDADRQKASAVAVQKALGGGSGPSWLKGAGTGTGLRKKPNEWLKSSQPGNSSFSAPPSRSNSSSQLPRSTTTAPITQNRPLAAGELREDAAGSLDIEPRDILRSMELLSKEKRALSKAYGKQD